ncbi:NADPH-dependent FMN reductase [Sporomusa acidovorans]|uniref:Quinone reductase n=1 Tax=Sporomusa acidovorans (strain ATCC 49682 / DSM 3132 / Mol) TaxID=1123286 RepID=A0ABZ3IYL3_SPOA4|nr:NAD(P)H-dependent oxidoreductase [Sporomusa acidovorans]OZC16825.1 NADPH-dependent FMN reductase [Sporomusa acidovorans DSM 3132]SDF23565.1 NAD(P)H-dependent FMN reductase [Sporomusa acidovorans]
MAVTKIGVLIGSLRKDSFNRKIYMALKSMVPASFEMEEIKIGDLPIYNQDFDDEGNPPEAWSTFRKNAKAFDAFLFVTPEYNRSIPAVIKNAIDVGSRPYGKSVWDGKPGAVVSVSPGRLSAFGANHHLRQSLVFLNIPVMQQPEAYIGDVASIFDDRGAITDERTREFLQKFVDAFINWIKIIASK